MNKLTKEQAAWLIDKINREGGVSYGMLTPPALQAYEDIMQIINQCTEQEFPELHIDDVHITRPNDSFVYILISYPQGSRLGSHMSVEDFKDFAIGVTKIAEWLENETS